MPCTKVERALARKPTTRCRPTTLTPSLTSGIAAIAEPGMNSSSSAVGGRPGSACVNAWANRSRAVSSAS